MLYDIRVKRALREKIERTVESRLRLEGTDELIADDPPFLLRFGNALETCQETLTGVDKHQVHPERATEDIAHEVGLPEAQEPVVNKDRCQAIPDRAVDERGRHRRIDSSAETEQNPSSADLVPDLPDGAIDEMLCGPVRLARADVDEEIA